MSIVALQCALARKLQGFRDSAQPADIEGHPTNRALPRACTHHHQAFGASRTRSCRTARTWRCQPSSEPRCLWTGYPRHLSSPSTRTQRIGTYWLSSTKSAMRDVSILAGAQGGFFILLVPARVGRHTAAKEPIVGRSGILERTTANKRYRRVAWNKMTRSAYISKQHLASTAVAAGQATQFVCVRYTLRTQRARSRATAPPGVDIWTTCLTPSLLHRVLLSQDRPVYVGEG